MDITIIKKIVESIRLMLRPDGDWLPVFLVEDKEKINCINLGQIPDKDLAAKMMEIVIRETNPDEVAFVATGWLGEPLDANQFDSEEDVEEAYREGWIPSPSEDPDRKEIVMIIRMNSKLESWVYYSVITRFEDKCPDISEWKEFAGPDKMSGRFAEAMEKGFASANETGTPLDQIPFLKKD